MCIRDRNRDQLIFKGDANKINSSWSINEAKLTLTGIGGVDVPYLYLVEAVKSVSFFSSSQKANSNKSISITLGNANYLPSTGHYYQFISDLNITWTEAKTAAENKDYYVGCFNKSDWEFIKNVKKVQVEKNAE